MKSQVLNSLLVQNPFERFILDLVEREDKFERQLALEHVEDTLMDKQVTMYDEDNMTQGSRDPRPYVRALDLPNTYELRAYKLLEDTALINRQRRNFRLLRDWQQKRPWYVLTCPDVSREFTNHLQEANIPNIR
jgi:hypothetical protein